MGLSKDEKTALLLRDRQELESRLYMKQMDIKKYERVQQRLALGEEMVQAMKTLRQEIAMIEAAIEAVDDELRGLASG